MRPRRGTGVIGQAASPARPASPAKAARPASPLSAAPAAQAARPAPPPSPPPVPEPSDTQRRILDAALALFAERGYDGVSTAQIAARAVVAEKTLFANFGTK